MYLIEHKFTDDEPAIIDMRRFEGPLTIAVTPGDGASLAVELSLDNGRSYTAWEPGVTVSEPTNATTAAGQTPTHVKVTQTNADTVSWIVISK